MLPDGFDGLRPGATALAQGAAATGPSMPWLVTRGRALPLRHVAGGFAFGSVCSVTELVQNWAEFAPVLRAVGAATSTVEDVAAKGVPVDSLSLESPLRPRQTFCTIGNYRRQVIESAVDGGDGPDGPRAAQRRTAVADQLAERARSGAPYLCLTSSERIGDPCSVVEIPRDVDTLDWEVEIAVVLGTDARRIGVEQAATVVAGYCVANDLTIRSRVVRDDVPVVGSDWLQCKGLPGSLPLGPFLVPSWEVPDPTALRLRLTVNGIVMQDDTADDMLFGIDQQLAYLSHHTVLRPGDVVCTGSPAGFGAHHGRYLRPGDVVTAEVSGLGRQRITFRSGEGGRRQASDGASVHAMPDDETTRAS